MLHSPEYQSMLQQMHQSKKDWGSTAGRHAVGVLAFCGALGAKSILDYGCGKQSLAKAITDRVDIAIDGYDPGIAGLDKDPEPADVVVSIDVLEHVEPEHLDSVLHHIKSKAKLGVFLLACTRKAKFVLPDGRNAHLIVQPASWWIAKVREVFPDIVDTWYGDDEVIIKARVA